MRMAIVRLVVMLILIINQILIGKGWTPLPYDEEQIYEFVNGLALVAVSIWAWWKNNSITKEAQKADKVLAYEKKRNKAARQ
ncbi:phage holin [Nosocomiicoccus massiliensis]|uniref:phage holin n=1 Tax=Nosocomiicoccus massiliensis TaxID=1232430 RepID=UPI0004096127|nr:phage holin [Nosocomiicoccus massiliensis]